MRPALDEIVTTWPARRPQPAAAHSETLTIRGESHRRREKRGAGQHGAAPATGENL
jgi:hypothetical protein